MRGCHDSDDFAAADAKASAKLDEFLLQPIEILQGDDQIALGACGTHRGQLGHPRVVLSSRRIVSCSSVAMTLRNVLIFSIIAIGYKVIGS